MGFIGNKYMKYAFLVILILFIGFIFLNNISAIEEDLFNINHNFEKHTMDYIFFKDKISTLENRLGQCDALLDKYYLSEEDIGTAYWWLGDSVQRRLLNANEEYQIYINN